MWTNIRNVFCSEILPGYMQMLLMKILRGSPRFLEANVGIGTWPNSIPTEADLRNVGAGGFSSYSVLYSNRL